MLADAPHTEVVAEPRGAPVYVADLVRRQPDVILLGPGSGRPSLVARLLDEVVDRSGEPPRIIAIVTDPADAELRATVRAGAMGFLRADARQSTVLEVVAEAAAGAMPTSRASRSALLATLAAPSGLAARARVDQLTPREQDVLRLVARGLSNAEVAAELVVTTSTVKTHMNAILGKLELRDRVQATVFAYESGLVRPGLP